jgi:hypothetical protein
MSVKFKLNDLEVVNVEIDGIDMKDYPDFCDAYIDSAEFKYNGKKLDDGQLAELMEQNPMALGEACFEECLGIADLYYSN